MAFYLKVCGDKNCNDESKLFVKNENVFIDYMSDVKNLIESAYFTKQGDKLISAAKKTATSDAYKDLHQKLKASKGKRHAGGGSQNQSESSDSLTSLLGKTLLKQ